MNKIEQFEQACAAPRTMLQYAADHFAMASRARAPNEYLKEFQGCFERLLEALEGPVTRDLEARGPSDDLMHEWQLFIAQGRDFLAALAGEIERAG